MTSPSPADDVLFSAKALMSPLVDSAPGRGYFTDLTDVQIIEPRKVRFTFRKPNVLNAYNLGSVLSIVPNHVFDDQGLLDSLTFKDIISAKGLSDPKARKFGEEFNKSPHNRAPVGTGPWRFEHWDTGKELVLVRNDNYWGEKAHLDRIVYRFIQDYTAALTTLKSGEIDFNQRISPIQYAQRTATAFATRMACHSVSKTS